MLCALRGSRSTLWARGITPPRPQRFVPACAGELAGWYCVFDTRTGSSPRMRGTRRSRSPCWAHGRARGRPSSNRRRRPRHPSPRPARSRAGSPRRTPRRIAGSASQGQTLWMARPKRKLSTSTASPRRSPTSGRSKWTRPNSARGSSRFIPACAGHSRNGGDRPVVARRGGARDGGGARGPRSDLP